jgi:hypothetical protein
MPAFAHTHTHTHTTQHNTTHTQSLYTRTLWRDAEAGGVEVEVGLHLET